MQKLAAAIVRVTAFFAVTTWPFVRFMLTSNNKPDFPSARKIFDGGELQLPPLPEGKVGVGGITTEVGVGGCGGGFVPIVGVEFGVCGGDVGNTGGTVGKKGAVGVARTVGSTGRVIIGGGVLLEGVSVR